MTARELIELLGLEPMPVEGGHFRQTYVARDRLPSGKPVSTAIYYLLTDEPDGFSALHRLPTDELYHFYLGDPVEMLHLYADGRGERLVLGPDLAAGQRVQHVAPRGVWQGSRLVPGGRFALLGATMAPGFSESDFESGDREALLKSHPAQADLIRALTRP